MIHRWISSAAGIVVQVILGGIYAWSPLLYKLGETYGLSNSQGGFIFGLSIAIFTLTMITAGRILAVFGPQSTAGIGAVLFMGGYLLASFSQGIFGLLVFGLGVIAGAGIGFGYVCPLVVAMKWFPNHKGLVTGISVAGFGSGAILLSATANHFLNAGMDVLIFFRWWGIVAGSVLLIAAAFLTEPATRKTFQQKPARIAEVGSLQFMICVVGIFAGTFAGLLVNGNLTPIIAESGVQAVRVSHAVSLFAVGNVLGRIGWGILFDKFGYTCIPISLFTLSAACLLLSIPLPGWLFLIGILCVGFFFGANFVIYAATIARCFGQVRFSILYPICFLAYGFAGFIAPGIGGYFADLTGSYLLSLSIAVIIMVLAGIVSLCNLTAFSRERCVSNS